MSEVLTSETHQPDGIFRLQRRPVGERERANSLFQITPIRKPHEQLAYLGLIWEADSSF